MTFDLHEGHHHLKLASVVLLIKFGSPRALFNILTPGVPGDQHVPRLKYTMRIFGPGPTHLPNIIKVGHTVSEKCSGQKNLDGGQRTAHGARRTDIWIT